MTAANLSGLYPDGRVALREVGLRDGLQLTASFPSTEGKKRWIEAEYAAGVRYFDAGSFLPPARHPQFADVRDIVGFIDGLPGAVATVLTLNVRGAADALETPAPQLDCVVSATESHSLRNVRRTREEALGVVAEICRLREGSAHRPVVAVGISNALGCTIEGRVDPADVYRLAGLGLDAGADIVSIADTVGYAGPRQVADMVRTVRTMADGRPVGVHLHDTRGLGLANASAALDEGATLIDGSLGGLGGCPAAPKATGNIVFEDLAFLCRTKGIDTGIDVRKLIALRKVQAEEMPGETFYGALEKAGLPLGLESSPAAQPV
ncbi:MAG: hydroxymethylglutaryl-CoA lyase [Rhodospirillaceae bacterium]|nr:hydroxymethylglutaryl-CoA lyase [Rhodospirillaceae bacterium]